MYADGGAKLLMAEEMRDLEYHRKFSDCEADSDVLTRFDLPRRKHEHQKTAFQVPS